MYLAGQAAQRGYAMAALLVMMSVMAVMMTALLPVWRQQAQREKEAELAFRGEQYARAIYLFRTKNGNQAPPNIDVLVQGKYLRKKYKDPITGDDFQPIFGGQQPQQPGPQGRGANPTGRGGPATGQGGVVSGGGIASPAGRGGAVQTEVGTAQGRGGALTPTSVGSGSTGAGQGSGGIRQGGTGLVTVVSKSKEPSIRIYNNAAYYNQWQFLYNARGREGMAGEGGRSGAPGVGPGRGAPGAGRGAPGSGPDRGRGRGEGGRGPGRGFGRGPG